MKKALKIAPYFAVGIFPVLLLALKAGKEILEDRSILIGIFTLQREGLLLLKTLAYSGSVAVTTTCVGILAAVFICGPGRTLFTRYKWVVFLSLPIPGCIHSLAWLRWNGILNDTGFISSLSRGWLMSWFVHSMALLPVAVLITAGGVFLLNKEQIRAAQLLGSDTVFLIRLLPGYLKPQILASLAIVFLLTINDYAIPSIFSVNVYSLEIFVEYSSSLSMTRTMIKSMPLILIELIILLFIPELLSKTFLSGKKGELMDTRLKFGKGASLLGFFAFAVIILQFAVPVSVLSLDKAMWTSLVATFTHSLDDLGTSIGICALAVALGMPVIYLTASWLNGIKRLKAGLFFVLLPSILPAALIGTSYINLFNSEYMNFIYDSIMMPVLVIMARFIPFGAIAVLAEMKRMDRSLLDAARILDRSSFRTSIMIVIPITLTSIVIGTSLLFLFGLGELGATVMVLPPGMSTVTVRLYNYLHYGSSEMVLGISFILILIVAVIYFIVKLLVGSNRHDRAG